MAQNFALVDVEEPPAEPIPVPVDWEKCALCQDVKIEKLTQDLTLDPMIPIHMSPFKILLKNFTS